MSWTAEQERLFKDMRLERDEFMSTAGITLSMTIDPLGLESYTKVLIDNAARIIKALEPFAALKEQK